jgi:vacuolar-type H+-ATPase subunit F/Vma7
MAGFVVIADELTCAGFRLAGIRTLTPEPETTREAFGAALKEAAVVIVTAAYARRLPSAELEAAMSGETPAVAVIPDIRERDVPPSLAPGIRKTLGIEE